LYIYALTKDTQQTIQKATDCFICCGWINITSSHPPPHLKHQNPPTHHSRSRRMCWETGIFMAWERSENLNRYHMSP